MSILTNPILRTDSYKFSHDKQYPADTVDVYAYLSARGSKIPGIENVIMFNLQPFIRTRMLTPVTRENVEQAKIFCAAHAVPFNYDGWMYIVNNHNGFLPVEIRAVPEGTKVPIGMPMVTIHTTDEKCAWLSCYLETEIMQHVWYGSTVATISKHCKNIIMKALLVTSDDPEGEINFKLHDFGFRGVSSNESAGRGGAAHLINFMGTDTTMGILHAMEYYGSDVCAYSIPASEHSTMTSWGRMNEMAAYWNMLDKFATDGAVFAMVIDSYDWRNAVKMLHADGFFTEVAKRNATVVLRPDSGDAERVPLELIELLMELVGCTRNSKGYDVLPKHIRVIQGDGITAESLPIILRNLEMNQVSASNNAFGMGAGLLQKCDRDTFKFAMKCSAIKLASECNQKWRDVYKDPFGDKSKKSLRGRVTSVIRDGQWEVMTLDALHECRRDVTTQPPHEALRIVYSHNGNVTITNFTTFAEVRERAMKPITHVTR